jgi:hypothetical protein
VRHRSPLILDARILARSRCQSHASSAVPSRRSRLSVYPGVRHSSGRHCPYSRSSPGPRSHRPHTTDASQVRMVSSSSNSTFAIASQLVPSSSSTSALARRARRLTAEPSRASAIRSCRDAASRKPGQIMRSVESDSDHFARVGAQSHGVRVYRRRPMATVSTWSSAAFAAAPSSPTGCHASSV